MRDPHFQKHLEEYRNTLLKLEDKAVDCPLALSAFLMALTDSVEVASSVLIRISAAHVDEDALFQFKEDFFNRLEKIQNTTNDACIQGFREINNRKAGK